MHELHFSSCWTEAKHIFEMERHKHQVVQVFTLTASTLLSGAGRRLSHTRVSVVVLYIRKALKVATAAKVIPRGLIKFASTRYSRAKKPLESAGKVCEITKDENSGLFQLLWDDNTQPPRKTRPSCFSALVSLPALRKRHTFF